MGWYLYLNHLQAGASTLQCTAAG